MSRKSMVRLSVSCILEQRIVDYDELSNKDATSWSNKFYVQDNYRLRIRIQKDIADD